MMSGYYAVLLSIYLRYSFTLLFVTEILKDQKFPKSNNYNSLPASPLKMRVTFERIDC